MNKKRNQSCSLFHLTIFPGYTAARSRTRRVEHGTAKKRTIPHDETRSTNRHDNLMNKGEKSMKNQKVCTIGRRHDQ